MKMQEGENMQENETIVENTKKKTTKKGKKKTKFKAIYLVPVIFVLIVVVVALSVFQSALQDGPIHGDRCVGVASIEDSVIENAQSALKQNNSSIEDLLIEVKCKTIAIDITMVDGSSEDVIKETCENILLEIDNAVGLSKSNSESKYSDLFGTYNGKTQYHVDFTIEGAEEIYPIFASKHPKNDEINFTYNTARSPELVDELTSEQPEDDTTTE